MVLRRSAIAMLCILCCGAQALHARLRTECFTADCREGGQTVVCVSYDDATGEVRGLAGTRCGDVHWTIEHCAVEPDAGVLHGAADHVLHGLTWSIRLTVAADGSLMDLWGVNASGTSWRLRIDDGVDTL